MNEEWKPIEDKQVELKNIYEISNTGKVRNIISGKELKTYKTLGGYHQVNLYSKGKAYPRLLSRLVALAYLNNDDPENKTQVNHIDENKDRNDVSNLEWATPKQNANYGTRNSKISHTKSMPVEQIDVTTGKVIAIYPSVKVAKDTTMIRTIWETIKGKQGQSGGYYWRLA